MKTVLCYGDSNTWGYVAPDGERLGRWERWPGVLQSLLGDRAYVVEEGLNGRTTVFDVPADPDRNGLTYLPVALETHAPVDVLVLFLGVNDMFLPHPVSARWVAASVGALVDSARGGEWGPAGGPPDVVVLVPPPFGPLGELEPWSPYGEDESARFSEEFAQMATEHECELLDLNGAVAFASVDGIHLDAAGHLAVGRLLADRLGTPLEANA
jgi:lysophospholipase L1-like esterase